MKIHNYVINTLQVTWRYKCNVACDINEFKK